MNRLLILLCLSFAIHSSLQAADSQAKTGAAMTKAAATLAASLSQADAAKIMLKYDDSRRTDWHNIPKPERKGLPLRDMSNELKDATHELLKASLSESGYQ